MKTKKQNKKTKTVELTENEYELLVNLRREGEVAVRSFNSLKDDKKYEPIIEKIGLEEFKKSVTYIGLMSFIGNGIYLTPEDSADIALRAFLKVKSEEKSNVVFSDNENTH